MFPVFKKGCKKLVENYRPLSVMNCVAKLYEMVMCSRLSLWFSPFREQAGSQKGRGCLEQIVTLRLITDLFRKKKILLYVAFIDFSAAYDRVSRRRLFTMMRRLGCGATMLAALVAMYSVTRSVIGTAVITTTIGVRQGSPTSCLLFVLFVNDLIRIIRARCGVDGILGWLHVLMFMDDTVLLSTTRESMEKKLSLLQEWCNNNGMKVNTDKTKFFAITGTFRDRRPFILNGFSVKWCDTYVYLGSAFTSDGNPSSAVVEHARLKTCHLLKFISFIKKNRDIPFYVKKRIFDAALTSSIMYACESWMAADLRPVIKLFNMGLKTLLGVRMTTCNDMCYIEADYVPLPVMVRRQQRKYFRGMWEARRGMLDDPLVHAITLTLQTESPTSRLVQDLVSQNTDDVALARGALQHSVATSTASRPSSYRWLNPDLSTHEIYTKRYVSNEVYRIAFSQFRLCGHNLAIETGRWNRRGRGWLPMEERLCPCGAVQTEPHVVEGCPMTADVRRRYGFTSWAQLVAHDFNFPVDRIVHEILTVYL